MKFITRRRTAAAILAGVLCLSLAGCAAGSSGSDAPAESVYSPVVPQNPIAEDVPGENLGAEIGETVSYQEKVTASLNQVIELDDTDKTKSRTLIAEMTITNNSDAAIDCSTLTHFSANIDGEEKLVAVRDIMAAVLVRKYYSQINSSLMPFNQAIEPGASATGYVYLSVPPSWSSLELVYIPYKYYSNDTITFDIKESDLVHYTEKLP